MEIRQNNFSNRADISTAWARIMRDLANNARREEVNRRRAANQARLAIEPDVPTIMEMEIEHVEL